MEEQVQFLKVKGIPAAYAAQTEDIDDQTVAEATRKAQMKPGTEVHAEPQGEALLAGQREQQEEPGLALSPDGPGASPEPPTLTLTHTHTLNENTTTDTLASDLLRKLAERQEVSTHSRRVKEEEEPMEDDHVATSDLILRAGPVTEEMLPSNPRGVDPSVLSLKLEGQSPPGAAMANRALHSEGRELEGPFHSGTKMADHAFFGSNVADKLQFRVKMEEPDLPGPKMADQCLTAVLWQDMSVNLASALLHQLSASLSELGLDYTSHHTAAPPQKRCHVCGFETEGRGLFESHMTEHRKWECSSFSLHCFLCDHSTNQEAEIRAHVDTHIPGDTGVSGEMRCHVSPPAAAANTVVAMETQPASAEHRCRICQRSFPGQQELQVHFQGHRQGNQYRCDRCGHLTRTANKLVEHVRVHTGERPFTCDLCPYSAKRRDSLRLHCKPLACSC
ncbi:zinc finger protein 62 homolog [Lampris incognitus]|uniref:zinc finger protein 62 homolog n=1 Tax=Lampris incognitus TaxID=2546036 RepID=UPI0024B520C1|nr:zinc finger protein 62 homolog [Lampris incognitus]